MKTLYAALEESAIPLDYVDPVWGHCHPRPDGVYKAQRVMSLSGLVLYDTILSLSIGGGGGEAKTPRESVAISLRDLAQHTELATETVAKALREITSLRMIDTRTGSPSTYTPLAEDEWRWDIIVPAISAQAKIRDHVAVMRNDGRWSELRLATFTRDGYLCQYCGVQLTETTATCDHIIPVIKGGTNDPANLATACRACNSGKGAKLLQDGGTK